MFGYYVVIADLTLPDHMVHIIFLLQNGWTALMFAVANSNIDMVRLLLDAGANTEAANKV